MKYNYNNIDINIYSDEEYNTINVKNYTNKLFKDSYSFDDACDIAENVVDMFNEVPGALLKYFQNDKDFIVSQDKITGLYGIKYSSPSVDWQKPYMILARGLVIDETGNLITVPYPKFFNYQQYTKELKPEYLSDQFIEYFCDYAEDESYEVLEKLDGSMISISNYNNELLFSTVNKPNSKFSTKAKNWVENNLNKKQIEALLRETLVATLLFEYVGPNNKIVIDYDKEELVLTGAISLLYGDSIVAYPHEELIEIGKDIGVRVASKYGDNKDYSAKRLLELGKTENTIEGFVLRFGLHGKQIKIKTEDYLEKHSSSTLFFGEPNTKFKNELIIQMIEDDTIDDVMAEMIQRGHTQISKHMQLVQNLYLDAKQELDMAYALVRYNGTVSESKSGSIIFDVKFSKSDYFKEFKGKFGLKQTLIVLFCEQADGTYLSRNSTKVKEAIKKHLLKELKKLKEV